MAVHHDQVGDAELIAFIVPVADDLAEPEVRAGLLATLPRNMVPARFVTTERIPLSPHGKVDRAALLDEFQRPAGGH